jgi:PAS domain S-box-containing protein
VSDDERGNSRTATADRILLAMQDSRDRDLLEDWLASFPRYEVDTTLEPAEMPAEYDLCILDTATFDAVRETLRERRERSDALFLPTLLTVSEASEDETRQYLEEDDDSLLDDIVGLPMAQALLRRRIENLLRARRSAVTLAERKHQYRQLIELTPEAMLLVDEGTIVYANEAASDLFDRSQSRDIEGTALGEFVDEADAETLDDVLAAIGDPDDTRNAEFVELHMVSAADRNLYVAVAGVEVVYEGRRMSQLIIRNLTLEQQRKERLNLFGRAMEAAAQGITIADARQDDQPLIYANRGFERITGYPMSDTLGRNCRFLQGRNTDEETVATIRDAIEREAPVSVDILNYRRDGTPFWNRLDIVPVENEAGEVTHFLGFQRDVTEQKEREQQLSVMNRVLRHNLRNKMNVIQVYAEQLREQPETAEAAESIATAAGDLLTISEQIRKFDSIVAADERDLETLDLVALIDRGVTALRQRSPESDIRLSLPDEALIEAHETLDPALTDLLTLTESLDGPSLTIDVAVEPETVMLTVTDRAGALDRNDLEVVDSEVETPLEHLETLELWLVRWAVTESHGDLDIDLSGDDPVIRMEFRRPDTSGE